MLIKETETEINFIDKNDNFVGFSYHQQCCENFGYMVTGGVEGLDLRNPQENLSLDGFWFDTQCEPVHDCAGYVEEGDSVAFKCVNDSGCVRYVVLFNSHSGWYSHGWCASWGDLEGNL